MPKKKPPKNAYFFFIMEKRREMEERGYRFPGGFDSAVKEFDHLWKRMSEEEKNVYKEKAKAARDAERGQDNNPNFSNNSSSTNTNSTQVSKKDNLANKYTVTGESYAQIQSKALDLQRADELMEKFILRLAKGKNSPDRIYIFIKAVHCVEEICKTKRRYWPGEISLVAFSLKGGIKSVYTQLIDTVEAPTGYASQAKENCSESGLPRPGDKDWFREDHRDYEKILKNILGFAHHWLKDGYTDVAHHRKVFFALSSEKERTLGCLQWLLDQIPGGSKHDKYQLMIDNLKIYKISKLIITLAEVANQVNPKYYNYLVSSKLESVADQVVTKGNYDYREEIVCNYHRTDPANDKMNHCAQSIVWRRVLMLFEELINAYEFPLTIRHGINALTGKKFGGPAIKRRRTRGPEEVRNVKEPSWFLATDGDDHDRESRVSHSPAPSTVSSSTFSSYQYQSSTSASSSSWAKAHQRREPPRAPGGTRDDDFPPLGAPWGNDPRRGNERNAYNSNDPRRERGNIFNNKGYDPRREKGQSVSNDPRLRREMEPSNDPRLGRDRQISTSSSYDYYNSPRARAGNESGIYSVSSTGSGSPSFRGGDLSEIGNENESAMETEETLNTGTESPFSMAESGNPEGAPMVPDSDEDEDDDLPSFMRSSTASISKTSAMEGIEYTEPQRQHSTGRGMGMGRATAPARMFMGDGDSDDEFPPLSSAPVGRGRGFGRGRGGGRW